MLNLFGDVEPFLELLEDAGLATVAKMQSILSDSKRKELLQLELAAIVDAGQPFVKATYRLEGDGPLAFSCFEELDQLLQAVRIAHYPNVGRVAQVLSKGQSQVVQQLVEYAISCVQPGLTYIQDKLKSELLPQVNAFKAARLLHPNKVSEMQPDLVAVDALSAFPFLSPCEIGNLKAELPQYLALAGDVNPQVDIVDWWHRKSSELPHWSAVASQLFLVQPSSAAAERVFSLLNCSFSDKQTLLFKIISNHH